MTPTTPNPQPMTDPQILGMYLRRALLVAVICLIGAAGVAAVEFKLGKSGLEPSGGRFRSRAQVMVDFPRLGAAEANQAYLPNVLRALGEDVLLQTQSVAQEVSKRIGGAYTPSEILDLVKYRAASGTPIMNIDARADSPHDAVSLAAAVVDVYRDRYKALQDAAQTPLQTRAEVDVITTPTLDAVIDEGPRATTRVVAGATVAGAVGLLLAFALPVDEIATGRRRRRSLTELADGVRQMLPWWPGRAGGAVS